MAKRRKYIYFFGDGKAEGRADMRNLLGGKGANLAEMTNLGIPVPAGFTITTEVCNYYFQNKHRLPSGLEDDVVKNIHRIERVMGARFGYEANPLLVSVRSGARASMPGMMDTILNLGLNFKTLKGLIERTDNARFGWDSFRRFIQMYGDVVMGIKPKDEKEKDPFEEILESVKKEKGVEKDLELDAKDLEKVVELYLKMIESRGMRFPLDPWEQIFGGIKAVFESWNTKRAIEYRRLNNIPEDWGTACNVQAMVFGNMGPDSATGVCFTRDPAIGEKRFFGEWLPNAQGEDVVAGIRTPLPITKDAKKSLSEVSLEEYMPNCYKQLVSIYRLLERHFRDVQDIEFTIQSGRLWILQTRNAKRTGMAAVRIAVDMVRERLISKQEAVRRIDAEALIQLLAPIFDNEEKKRAIEKGRLLAKGLNAGPGAACGRIVFTAEDVAREAKKGPVVLVRAETSPEDIHGMAVAVGILTARGGMTSHAALVARGMGKPCVVGCSALEIDYKKKLMHVSGKKLKQGDWISIDGTTGEVLEGQLKTYPSEVIQVLVEGKLKPSESLLYRYFDTILSWADEIRKLGVRCNADTPRDTAIGRKFGAEGIGLCRTEHMFFEPDRIDAMREMILAENSDERWKALEKILPMQRGDFVEIFKEMPGMPVTIRLLDPPLHEFVPHEEKEIKALAKKMRVPPSKVKARVEQLKEFNPMLGHRGCRLGITYPEIYDLQVRAIIEAACEVAKRFGKKPVPEIMIPIVGHKQELDLIRERSEKIINDILKEKGVRLDYKIGTMIEIPRAAVRADQIAEVAEFFSFGTNDLTQTTLGMSRDDSGSFLPEYVRLKIYQRDPFEAIDQEGVGELMKIAVEKGRQTRAKLKIGICGEHGGEPSSVEFCHRIGLNYVSCSPYRVPVARIAAAHAVLKEKEEEASVD